MAYPTYPAASAQQPRPTSVTVSSYLLWLTAGISLIGAVLTLSMVGRMTDAYRDVYAGTDAAGSEAVLVGVSVISVVINILFAAGLAILSIFNNRGRNGARVTTWVLGGVALCCSGLGLAGTAFTNSMNLDAGGPAGGPSPAEVERRLNESLPSWYNSASTTLSVISLLAILGAIILLAMPASNAFFRKPAAAWDPSMPYPYPPSGQPPHPQAGQPPYPQAGQPAGGQPPYPSYPPSGSAGGIPPYPTYPSSEPSTPPPPPPSGGPTPPPTSGDPTPPPTSGGPTPPADPWDRPPGEDDRRPPSGPAS